MLNISPAAIKKIVALQHEEMNPALALRVYVKGGGCQGLSYGFAFETEVFESDTPIVEDGAKVIVDGVSLQYLKEACLDYVSDLLGAKFRVINPNAQLTCRCGSSFRL